MKKVLLIAMSFIILQACGNNSSPSKVDEDGLKKGDTNGGLADTAFKGNQSATDTSKGEHRVDISKRDTFKNKPNH